MCNYKIDKNEVLRYLGYREQEISEELEVLINMCRNETAIKSKPKYIYEYFELESSEENIKVKGSDVYFLGKDIKKHLGKADKCCIMAVTLGQDIERYIKMVEKIDLTKAIILDACATTLVEEICDEAEESIRSNIENGKFITSRFSPGYGDLPICLQKDIINMLMTDKKIGLTASSHNLLMPRKSVTAIIGIGEEEIASSYNKCERCSNKTCIYRNRGQKCGY